MGAFRSAAFPGVVRDPPDGAGSWGGREVDDEQIAVGFGGEAELVFARGRGGVIVGGPGTVDARFTGDRVGKGEPVRACRKCCPRASP